MSVSNPRQRDVVTNTTLLVTACAVVNIVGTIVIALVTVTHLRSLNIQRLDVEVEVKGQFENKSETNHFPPGHADYVGFQPTLVADASKNESQSEDPVPMDLDQVVVLKVMTDEPLLTPLGSPGTPNSNEVLNPSSPETPGDPTNTATFSTQPKAHKKHTAQRRRNESPEVVHTLQYSKRPREHRQGRKRRSSASFTDFATPSAQPKAARRHIVEDSRNKSPEVTVPYSMRPREHRMEIKRGSFPDPTNYTTSSTQPKMTKKKVAKDSRKEPPEVVDTVQYPKMPMEHRTTRKRRSSADPTNSATSSTQPKIAKKYIAEDSRKESPKVVDTVQYYKRPREHRKVGKHRSSAGPTDSATSFKKPFLQNSSEHRQMGKHRRYKQHYKIPHPRQDSQRTSRS